MILNSKGHIAAPSEIVARLAQIHPALGMVWAPALNCFMMTYTWPDGDPRREMIRKGKIDPRSDYDAWGYAPQGVSVDDAYHCLVAGLKRNRQTSQAAQDMLDRVHLYNKQQEQRNLQPTLDYADEMIEYNAPRLFENTLGKTTVRHFVNRTGKAHD